MRKLGNVLVVLGIGSVLLGGCSISDISIGGLSNYTYDNAEKYTMGGATLTGAVEDVDISWISGDVNVSYHAKDSVIFSEESGQTLNEDNTLYYWLDNGTLYIKFAKSGNWDFSNLNKELNVWLPQELALSELEVNVISADVVIDEIVAKEAEIASVSGGIEFREARFSERVKVDTVSGGVTAALVGEVQEMDVDSVSGKMEISAEKIRSFDADSTSGRVNLLVSSAPASMDIDTISGSVEVTLPSDTGFTAELDTISGIFHSEIATRNEGDKYIAGDGSNFYKFDTTSGNVSIKTQK